MTLASIETLIGQVTDKPLQERLAREVAELKKRLSWGLVFERHLPENTRVLHAPIRTATVVWERRSAKPRRFQVLAVEADGEMLLVVPAPGNGPSPDAVPERIAREDVLVELDFAEPIYPALTSLERLQNGPSGRPYHAVIEGENYHALEALLVAYEGKVDCLYLDPPYNTGTQDSDWSYNNNYVDANDTFRPSKWLAFMERRLRLAKRMLKHDGAMVVTIDENEVHHLGMLLEQIFPDARRQMVSIVINPLGQERLSGLGRVDEQAFFLMFGDSPPPVGYGDDLLNERDGKGSSVRWERLLRGGEGSGRGERGSATLFYPVLIDPEKRRILGAGEVMTEGEPERAALVDGNVAVWPIRTNGSWGRWRIGRSKFLRLLEQGYVKLGRYDGARNSWTVLYLGDANVDLIEKGGIKVIGRDETGVVNIEYAAQRKFSVKTIWNRGRHNAGIYGSHLLTAFIGERGTFTFPKSLYAVADTLDVLIHDKPDALVMDFFAGSGTTLHATLQLNAQDGGKRRCVLVTNNELRAAAAARLNRAGHFRGDPEFESAGVFESACRPRVKAAVTGARPNGKPVEGAYLDGREYAEGFSENVEFFRLDYLDPAAVEFGLRFAELHPLLWLRAGGIGEREDLDPAEPLGLPKGSPYAVLFKPSGLPELLAALPERRDIRMVFIVADSAESFAALTAQIEAEAPGWIETVRLYREYLETLRGAIR